MNQGPTSRWHRHAAEGTFPHLRSSPLRALLSHRGLAHAITPHQTLVTINAAQLSRGDGSGTGTERALSASDHTERVRIGFSFSFNGFAATWTIFQDTRIVPFRSCCAIFAGVLQHISLS